MLKYTIVPAILEKTIQGIEEKLARVKSLTNYVQIDIIDDWPKGDNTVDPKELVKVKALRDFGFEVHLMVKEPVEYLTLCRKAGAQMAYGQVEYMSEQRRFVDQCHALQLKAGLSVDLPTLITKIDQRLLYDLDGILLMSIEAGAQGRAFSRKVLGKLKRMVRRRKETGQDWTIGIDGGINPQTGAWCLGAGANQLCVGSYLLKHEHPEQAWQELNNLISR